MTCKDCLHYEACENKFLPEEPCKMFSGKSGWVHLPCEVGDTLYKYNFTKRDFEALRVDGFRCDYISWKFYCTYFVPTWFGKRKKKHRLVSFSAIGSTAFCTKEEAEKALAGRRREAVEKALAERSRK